MPVRTMRGADDPGGSKGLSQHQANPAIPQEWFSEFRGTEPRPEFLSALDGSSACEPDRCAAGPGLDFENIRRDIPDYSGGLRCSNPASARVTCSAREHQCG